MNITHKEITIIVIIFLLFVVYLYYTKSMETFSQQSKPLEITYQDIVKNLYTNIESELDTLDNSSDIMNSLCNSIKNNGYNLKKISTSGNFKMNLGKLIENDVELTNMSKNMVNNFKLHENKDEIFDIIKNIYMDKSELYQLFQESNNQLLDIIKKISKVNWETDMTFDTNDFSSFVVVSSFADFSSTEINKHAKELFNNINKEITELIDVIDNTKLFDSDFKDVFKEVYINLKNLNKNLHIRYDTFNLYQVIKNLMELYLSAQTISLSSSFIKAHNDAIKEYKTNMRDLINADIKNIKELIQEKPSIVLSDEVEVQYLNIADSNNNILHNFCNKIRKIDKPNENNQMFIRFSKEFVDKKNKHIERLQKEIDTIQHQLYEEEINDFNTNKLRIDDQASKQYKAIMKAKENIENSKKFKLNIS